MAKILLGTPTAGHGLIHQDTVAAVIWAIGSKAGHRVVPTFIRSSAVARNFNQLWCMAQNDRSYNWFALLHADVAPAHPKWLDTMVEMATEHKLHVLANVIPFTNGSGVTSTGWATSQWSPRRATMKEIAKMPDIWRIGDTQDGEELPDLFNTGCILINTRIQDLCFEIHDRITRVHDEASGKSIWEAQMDSEDWRLSRWCKQNNIAAGITKAIPIRHHGTMAYENWGEWGEWETDRNYWRVFEHPEAVA